MIKPQYVRAISDIYTEMYFPPGDEKPLVLQEESLDVEETPDWKKVLQRETKKQNRKPPYAAHVEPREDASEEEEWTGNGIDDPDPKYNLAIKLVQEILGEEEHSEVAANTVYMIRDLVK